MVPRAEVQTSERRRSSGPQLLEREREREAIEGAIEAAIAGRGGAVALAGEPGLGKTSLLDLGAERAARDGARVVRARGDELERGFAWGGAVQLFSGVVRDPEAAAVLSGAAGLARPLLERADPAGAEAATTDPFPLLHGLYWLAANLSERAPLLIAVDDAHWMDAETLLFLNYLLGRIEALNLCLIVAARSRAPADRDRARLLARLRASSRTVALTLAPLGGDSIRRLVRDRVPDAGDDLCDAVGQATGGNPFLTIELAAAARREGLRSAESVARLGELRPDSIRNSIAARLESLGEDAKRIAAAVAILGPLASQRLATSLAAIEPGHAAAAIDALDRAGLVTEHERHLRFVHPIVREIVYADLPAARRSRDHLAAAKLLHACGASPEEVASQLLSAEPATERWAADALREAAALAATRGVPATAARLLRRALEEVERPEVRREILFELGRSESAAGEESAADRFRHALELPGEAPSGPRIAVAWGEALYRRGEYAQAMAAFEQGLDLLGEPRDEGDEVVEALLLGGLGSAGYLVRAPSARVRERIEGAIAAGTDPPSPADRVLLALATGAECLEGKVSSEEIIALGHRALAGDELPGNLAGSVLEPAVSGLAASDDEAGLRALDAVVARARRMGTERAYFGLLALRSQHRLRFGRLLPALADAEDAIRIAAEDLGDQPYLGVVRQVLACGLLDRGDPDAAARACDVPVSRAGWSQSFLFPAYHLFGVGRVALARGRAAEALAALRDAETIFRRVGPNPAICPWRSEAALAAARVGELELAAELADEELELARRFGARGAIGIALRGRALIDDSPARAVEMLREAASTLAGSPLGLEHARALIDLGAALRRGGWTRDSREPLREGLEQARAHGAGGLVERAAAELGAAGVRPRIRALSGVGSLTPSERRVAEMVAQGMSNREVAEALFVTRRTVETHLTHVYAKLGISSRDDLPDVLGSEPEAA